MCVTRKKRRKLKMDLLRANILRVSNLGYTPSSNFLFFRYVAPIHMRNQCVKYFVPILSHFGDIGFRNFWQNWKMRIHGTLNTNYSSQHLVPKYVFICSGSIHPTKEENGKKYLGTDCWLEIFGLEIAIFGIFEHFRANISPFSI